MPFIFNKSTILEPFVCFFYPFVGTTRILRGFTLIELVITVTVLGVLAGIALPALNTLIKNQRIATQANDFLADLNFAKSEAVKRSGISVIACARGVGGSVNACAPAGQFTNGWLVFVDSDGDTTIGANEPVLRDKPALVNNLTLRALAAGAACPGSNAGPRITFNSRGVITSGSGCYTLCDDRPNAASPDPRFGRQVLIGVSGQVRVASPATQCL